MNEEEKSFDVAGKHDAWWTIHSTVIQEMLHRAFNGEDPELLYIELIANSRYESSSDED